MFECNFSSMGKDFMEQAINYLQAAYPEEDFTWVDASFMSVGIDKTEKDMFFKVVIYQDDKCYPIAYLPF